MCERPVCAYTQGSAIGESSAQTPRYFTQCVFCISHFGKPWVWWSMPTSVLSNLDNVEVRRSRRRKSTVSAYRDGDVTVISIPARFTRTQEREWVEKMLEKLAAKEAKRRPSDDELLERAVHLNERYLGGHALPMSIKWSDNQERRWGSCTMPERSIRLSTRLRGLPSWVIDYVILHELTHILVQGHGPEFWAYLDAYPKTQRARGFLEGVTFAKEDPALADV